MGNACMKEKMNDGNMMAWWGIVVDGSGGVLCDLPPFSSIDFQTSRRPTTKIALLPS